MDMLTRVKKAIEEFHGALLEADIELRTKQYLIRLSAELAKECLRIGRESGLAEAIKKKEEE